MHVFADNDAESVDLRLNHNMNAITDEYAHGLIERACEGHFVGRQRWADRCSFETSCSPSCQSPTKMELESWQAAMGERVGHGSAEGQKARSPLTWLRLTGPLWQRHHERLLPARESVRGAG